MKTYLINDAIFVPDLSTPEGVKEIFLYLQNGVFSTSETIDYIRQIFNDFDNEDIDFQQLFESLELARDSEFTDALYEMKFRIANKIDLEKSRISLIDVIDSLDDANMLSNVNLELKIDAYLKNKNPKLISYVLTDLAVTAERGYHQIFATLQKFRLLEKNPRLVLELIARWDPTLSDDIENDLPMALLSVRKANNEVLTEANLVYLGNRISAHSDPYQMAVYLYNGLFDKSEAARYEVYSKLLKLADEKGAGSCEEAYLEIVRDRFDARFISVPLIDNVYELNLNRQI